METRLDEEVKTMKMVDFFCCQGGCSRGYMDSGLFESVVGVDINPQPRYPYEFIQGDAMELMADKDFMSRFDFAHASPPCQGYSALKYMTTTDHPELVPQTRALLARSGKPWVIENVVGAPITDALMLCGTMFGLKTRRHRLFETSTGFIFPPASCSCRGKRVKDYALKRQLGKNIISSWENGAELLDITGHEFKVDQASEVMGIDWMTGKGLSQAIPPVYTEYIARQMFG